MSSACMRRSHLRKYSVSLILSVLLGIILLISYHGGGSCRWGNNVAVHLENNVDRIGRTGRRETNQSGRILPVLGRGNYSFKNDSSTYRISGNNYVGGDTGSHERLMRAIGEYNDAVTDAAAFVSNRQTPWVNKKIVIWPAMTVSAWDDNFFDRIQAKSDQVTVLGYSHPMKGQELQNQIMNNTGLFLQKERYHVWSLDEFSCQRLKSIYKDKHLFSGICDKGHNYFGLGLKALTHGREDDHHVAELFEYHQYHSRLYVSILPKAYIEGNDFGYIYTSDLIVAPQACAEGWIKKPHDVFFNMSSFMKTWPLYDEVFVTAQHWGKMYYHWTIDQLPKIAIHLEFLKQRPRVKILINADASLLDKVIYRHLKMFGIDPARIIFGNVRAKLAYLPQGGGCVETFNALAVQLMSNHFLSFIADNPSPVQRRDSILLIHRTSKRWLEQHVDIASLLKRLAEERGLDFYVFSDKPTPSLEETMYRFNQAVVVVGPHGAGLSNLVYSRPGTAVLEVLCGPPDTTQYCYPFLSYALGLRHHGIGAVYGGCKGLIIHLAYLEAMVYMYLDQIILERNKSNSAT